jgi:acetylornithine aminotransferase
VAVAEEILSPGFLAGVVEKGNYLRSRLEELKDKHDVIKEVRGLGLMQAVDLHVPGADYAARLREAGVLVNCTCETVLRFLPPLIVTAEEIDEMVAVLGKVLANAGR